MRFNRLSQTQQFFTRLLTRWQPSETVLLLITGLLVGLAGGAGVWLFKRLIDLFHLALFDITGNFLTRLAPWMIALVPILGGLIVGWIVYKFIGQERHHGVAGIMEAAALAGGRLRYKRLPAKAIASALSIGSGASVGPEDPSVQIGANIGSMFGQWLHLSDERMRSLVAAGAASGIAAAFNAPIAGVFFALEIILGEISGSAFGVVVIAAVISAVFTQAVSGPEPAFHVPTYAFGSAWSLPLYLGLGLLAGPISALYIRLLYLAQDFFHNQFKIPAWAKPAAAGALVGLVGIFLPQVFGVGYETIGSVLNGQITVFWLLVALLAAKLLLTPVSIGGGFPGGVFAPALFIGAALGAAYGVGLNGLFPGLQLSPGAFAMVGMAAVLAGTVRAPLTAVILLFEMTNDYRIILPLMFAVVVSLLLSQRLIHDSVYTLGLARKGVRLEHGRDVEVLETITVGEIMQAPPLTLTENLTLAEASDIFQQTRHHGLPVVDEKQALIGIVTLQDLDQAQELDLAQVRVGDVCTRHLATVTPNDTIGEALHKMGTLDIGRMPVIASDNPSRLVGWLRRTDLVKAYEIALARRAAMRHRVHQVRLGAYTGGDVRVLEIPVQNGAPCDGKRVQDVPWPANCLIASVRQGANVIIPKGDTLLRAGNVLVMVVTGSDDEDIRLLLGQETH